MDVTAEALDRRRRPHRVHHRIGQPGLRAAPEGGRGAMVHRPATLRLSAKRGKRGAFPQTVADRLPDLGVRAPQPGASRPRRGSRTATAGRALRPPPHPLSKTTPSPRHRYRLRWTSPGRPPKAWRPPSAYPGRSAPDGACPLFIGFVLPLLSLGKRPPGVFPHPVPGIRLARAHAVVVSTAIRPRVYSLTRFFLCDRALHDVPAGSLSIGSVGHVVPHALLDGVPSIPPAAQYAVIPHACQA